MCYDDDAADTIPYYILTRQNVYQMKPRKRIETRRIIIKEPKNNRNIYIYFYVGGWASGW